MCIQHFYRVLLFAVEVKIIMYQEKRTWIFIFLISIICWAVMFYARLLSEESRVWMCIMLALFVACVPWYMYTFNLILKNRISVPLEPVVVNISGTNNIAAFCLLGTPVLRSLLEIKDGFLSLILIVFFAVLFEISLIIVNMLWVHVYTMKCVESDDTPLKDILNHVIFTTIKPYILFIKLTMLIILLIWGIVFFLGKYYFLTPILSLLFLSLLAYVFSEITLNMLNLIKRIEIEGGFANNENKKNFCCFLDSQMRIASTAVFILACGIFCLFLPQIQLLISK